MRPGDAGRHLELTGPEIQGAIAPVAPAEIRRGLAFALPHAI